MCLFLFFWFMNTQISRSLQQSLITSVSQRADNVSIMINEQFRSLESISAYVSRYTDPPSENMLSLMEAFSQNNSFEYVQYADADGTIYRSDFPTANVSDRDYFQDAMAGENVVSSPIESKIDGVSRIMLAVPVRDEDNEVNGVLIASLNIGRMIDQQFLTTYHGTGKSFFCDPEGELITPAYYSNLDMTGNNLLDYITSTTERMEISSRQLYEDFSSGNSRAIRVIKNDKAYYVTYVPSGINDWILCYTVPYDDVTTEYTYIREAEFILGISIFGGIILMLLILFYTMRKERVRLEIQAQTDALTGLKNRNALQSEITLLLTQSSAAVCLNAFIICDIDNFKNINDTYGHAVGDIVLQQFGKLLQCSFRNTDIVGRLGGDEFVIFLCRLPDRKTGENLMEKLHQRVGSLKIPGYEQIHLGSSMGMAFSPTDGSSFDMLYRKADTALYRSKALGKNRLTVYSDN